MENIDFEFLNAKQEELRGSLSQDVGLRVHRAVSWVGRAEQDAEDFDASFIFYWIAFNAAYAKDMYEAAENERQGRSEARYQFGDFFSRIISLDKKMQIESAIWENFPGSIRLLLENQFVYEPFWKFNNQIAGYEKWEKWFKSDKKEVRNALGRRNTKYILKVLFNRLYVLRNQLVHGGATWNGSLNRDQVRDGASIMAFLVPLFIDLMMDNPEEPWGPPYYPILPATARELAL